jgi:multiple sugar transport system permease protein
MAVLTQRPAPGRHGGRRPVRWGAAGVPEASRHVAGARRARRRRFLSFVATHAVLLALTIIFCAPVVFVFLTALMTDRQALTADLWPHQWVWSNFATLFDQAPMLTWLRNTMVYALAATALMLVSSVPVAYALARFRFPGRRVALLAVIATMMLPPQVVAVPLYVLWARYHLTGTLWPLVVPMLFGDAFSIFLLRQFMVSLPPEYADAARMDGCGELGVLLRVMLPMMRPALAAVALFQFFYCWNDYYGPLLYVGETPANWTLSVGLASFRGVHHVQWNLTMAATLLVMLPVIVVFLLAQRVFVEGVTLTGVKG